MIVNGIAENRILPHLLNEGGIGKYVCSSQEVDIGGDHNSPAVEDDEKQQKNMIENFKSTVIKQQQIKTSHIVPARGISVQQAKSFMENQRKNVPLKNPPHLMSHSQPCLVYTTASAANNYPQSESPESLSKYQHLYQLSTPADHHRISSSNLGPMEDSSIDPDALKAQIIQFKQYIGFLHKKLSKLDQLCTDYKKIEIEFGQLLLQQENRDALEAKMRNQINLLTTENGQLQEQIQQYSELLNADINPLQLELLLNDLIPKNKQLLLIQERQRIELEAQAATLEEQRVHIDVLEKALTNARERLVAKDRQSVDAAAVVEKCCHLQKQLQESQSEIQRSRETHKREKAKLEMEISRMHTSRENGSLRTNKKFTTKELSSIKNSAQPGSPLYISLDELYELMLKKEDRITQLESRVLEFQKDTGRIDETETFKHRIRMLEEEKSDRDRRLQDMLDEKRHLYKQFTDERRSLDVRVRQLEYDIRYLIGNHSFGSHPCVTPFSNSPLEHTVVHKSNGVENHLIKDFSTYDLDLSNELLSKQRFSDSLWKFKRPADDTATHIAHADDVSPLSGSSSFIDKAARSSDDTAIIPKTQNLEAIQCGLSSMSFYRENLQCPSSPINDSTSFHSMDSKQKLRKQNGNLSVPRRESVGGCRRLIREHSVEAIRNSLVKRPSIGIDKEEPVGTEDMVSLPSCTSLICKQNIVQSNSNGISSIEINDGTYSNHSTNQDQVELPTVVQVNQNTPIPNNSEQSS